MAKKKSVILRFESDGVTVTFEREQKIFKIDGVSIGGQQGELATALY